jgi:1-acyl-sn-glycerol-3-phosphate acyltransferase
VTGSQAPSRTYEPALKLNWWVWHLVYAGARLSLAIRFRIRFKIPPDVPRGPVLLACKHVSAWDIPLATYLVRHALQGRKPYFQMGSFIGYPVFGRIVPAMQACGGFSVLRPKEVLRLRKDPGQDRARMRALMDEVNGVAEATRRAVLARGGVIVVFPEGTRDARAVQPVRSMHEIQSALAIAETAEPAKRPVILPAIFNYGKKRRFRRTVDVEIAAPIPLDGQDAPALAARIEQTFRERWRAPAGV